MLERSFAYSSGVGFIGKNNMLIILGYGSYFYLAEILTTATIDIPVIDPCTSLCGSCTACIDACPTGALKGALDFDASLCLSYLTIEAEELVNPFMGKLMNRCFLGCDICQEVCPLNSGKPEIRCMPSTESLMKMTDDDFYTGLWKDSPFTARSKKDQGKHKGCLRGRLKKGKIFFKLFIELRIIGFILKKFK
jgi:epoxyqueuosine reductase